MANTPTKPANRRRSSSVTTALSQVPLNQAAKQMSTLNPIASNAVEGSEVKPLSGPSRPKKAALGRDDLPEFYHSRGLKDDLKTGRWMLVPSSAFFLLALQYVLYRFTGFLLEEGVFPKEVGNPFEYLLFPQYKQPNGLYRKGWADLLFVFDHVIFWSFVRQIVTIRFLRPLAKALGIKGAKIMRFTEQGYAIFYFSLTSIAGLYVMHGLPTWWYKTEHFWIDYPHRDMTLELKAYYLLQASYWIQQTILLAGKIEKPRKDFKELIAHHAVTLWLIGWSYNVHMTYIGVSIFVTMDFSDVFLALAKCVNYVNETASQPVFAFFIVVWTYFRHYLNLKILWSVLTEFELIGDKEPMVFRPLEDLWMAPWMKWQIFIPIALLQIINLFWYFLIWRILLRALFKEPLKDERSDDEEGEEDTTEKVKAE